MSAVYSNYWFHCFSGCNWPGCGTWPPPAAVSSVPALVPAASAAPSVHPSPHLTALWMSCVCQGTQPGGTPGCWTGPCSARSPLSCSAWSHKHTHIHKLAECRWKRPCLAETSWCYKCWRTHAVWQSHGLTCRRGKLVQARIQTLWLKWLILLSGCNK